MTNLQHLYLNDAPFYCIGNDSPCVIANNTSALMGLMPMAVCRIVTIFESACAERVLARLPSGGETRAERELRFRRRPTGRDSARRQSEGF